MPRAFWPAALFIKIYHAAFAAIGGKQARHSHAAFSALRAENRRKRRRLSRPQTRNDFNRFF